MSSSSRMQTTLPTEVPTRTRSESAHMSCRDQHSTDSLMLLQEASVVKKRHQEDFDDHSCSHVAGLLQIELSKTAPMTANPDSRTPMLFCEPSLQKVAKTQQVEWMGLFCAAPRNEKTRIANGSGQQTYYWPLAERSCTKFAWCHLSSFCRGVLPKSTVLRISQFYLQACGCPKNVLFPLACRW